MILAIFAEKSACKLVDFELRNGVFYEDDGLVSIEKFIRTRGSIHAKKDCQS